LGAGQRQGNDWAPFNRQEGVAVQLREWQAYNPALRWCLRFYETNLSARHKAALPTLKGKRLGCFCKPGDPCHGDMLVRMVEEME
jgi:hypothetical protein